MTLLTLLLPDATAHAVQPAILGVTLHDNAPTEVVWTPPQPEVPGLVPVFPPGCTNRVLAPGRAWTLDCASQPNAILTVDGLLTLGVPVLARVAGPTGVTTTLLTAGHPDLPLQTPTIAPGPAGWVRLGAVHVLSGLDHLLFLAGLLLLTRGVGGGLLLTLTGFTLAHSFTLAASVLGWIHIPSAPVEACIALSIVIVAREAARPTPPRASPALAAGFGLLHGLGFAAGLGTSGIPRGDVPRALLGFNVGVEVGQLLFVAVVGAAARWVRVMLGDRLPDSILRPWLAAALGTVGMAWVWERVAAFSTGG